MSTDSPRRPLRDDVADAADALNHGEDLPDAHLIGSGATGAERQAIAAARIARSRKH